MRGFCNDLTEAVSQARAAVREAAGGDLWRLQTLRPHDLSRKLPLSRWEAAARDAFLEAARDLRAGELGFENACEWLDDVVEAAGGAAAGTTVFLPHGDAGESLRDSIVPRGVVISLGGGIDPMADLMWERRLLGADSPVAALIYFDTDGAALSTATSGYPRDAAVRLEIPDAWKGYARGDVHQLLDPARRAEILGGRPVTFLLNTPSCKPHAAVVVDRDKADTKGLEKFLEVEKRLAEDTAAALLAAGAPEGQQMHALGEFGNTPAHVDAIIKAVLGRSTFRLNAAKLSALSRLRTFCSTFPQRPVADDDPRRLQSPREVLDAYLKEHGDRVLLPTYGPGYVVHEGNAVKARTPRALAPPDRGAVKSSVEAALAKAHGGVNFAAPPPAATPSGTGWTSRRPRSSSAWKSNVAALLAALLRRGAGSTHRLISAQVLMGYRHDRVTVAPDVANDLQASWRLLGNTIQRAALEHVCAPFLDGLEELRDQMSDD